MSAGRAPGYRMGQTVAVYDGHRRRWRAACVLSVGDGLCTLAELHTDAWHIVPTPSRWVRPVYVVAPGRRAA